MPTDPSTWIEYSIPIIIEPELFDAVQKKLSENSCMNGKPHRKEDTFILRKILACGYCGSTLVFSGGGKYKRYYTCYRKYLNPKRANLISKEIKAKDCNFPYLNADKVEENVINHVTFYLRHPQNILKNLKAEADPSRLKQIETKLKGVNISIGKYEEKLSNQLKP